MTRTITAIALALGLFAGLSTSSHAALSTTDRPAVVAPAQTVEANASQGFDAAAPVATTATATTAQAAAPVTELRKPVIQKAKPRLASRFGYPCH